MVSPFLDGHLRFWCRNFHRFEFDSNSPSFSSFSEGGLRWSEIFFVRKCAIFNQNLKIQKSSKKTILARISGGTDRIQQFSLSVNFRLQVHCNLGQNSGGEIAFSNATKSSLLVTMHSFTVTKIHHSLNFFKFSKSPESWQKWIRVVFASVWTRFCARMRPSFWTRLRKGVSPRSDSRSLLLSLL